MFRALENYAVRVCGVNTTTEQVGWLRERDRRPRPAGAAGGARSRFPRGACPVRQGRLHRRAGTRRPRPVARSDQSTRRFPQTRRARDAAFHRSRRRARHRVLHPQARVPGRMDPEPGADHRGDGGVRAGGRRRGKPAPALRLHAGRLGRALRAQLGAHPRASIRSASTSTSAGCGAPICTRAPRCSARRIHARTCSRSCSAKATSRATATR